MAVTVAFNQATADNQAMTLGDDDNVLALIASAKAEDLGAGDVTSSLLADPLAQAEFRLSAKQKGVFAGREIASAVLSASSTRFDASESWRPPTLTSPASGAWRKPRSSTNSPS